MEKFLTYFLLKIIKKPEKFKIQTIESEHSLTLLIKVDKEDVGQVVGKKGRTIQALRTLLLAYLSKDGNFNAKQIVIKIEENKL